jgi:integrase
MEPRIAAVLAAPRANEPTLATLERPITLNARQPEQRCAPGLVVRPYAVRMPLTPPTPILPHPLRVRLPPCALVFGTLFTREDGSPIHPQALSEAFERHVKAAKLPTLSLHGLRHTHATIALRAGVHPKVVSERLGHASVAFTLDVYTDSLPDMQETAAALIAELVRAP